jgi:ferrous iron transport protein B
MEVALVGHPNVGKSVLFSRMTGVGAISSNYPGTTVEFLEGTVIHKGVRLHVFDLPGTYGLNGITEDEVVAVKLLAEHRPDVVVAVADATRLEPSLVMIYQLIELGFKVIVALNFMDVARRRHSIDVKLLQDILKVPVVPMVALTEEGVDILVESIIADRAVVSDFKIKYAGDIEDIVKKLTPAGSAVSSVYPVRGALLKLLEGNQYFTGQLPDEVKQIATEERSQFKLKHDEDIDVHINRDRYGEAGLTIRRVQSRVERKLTRGERISEITLKPSTGIPILLAVLVGVFISIVIIGGLLETVLSQIYLDLTSGFFSWLTTAIGGTFGQSISSGINLSIQAIISIVIPYILVFYLILALLEDSGYLPRVVILLDGVMHKFGLHGRAIIPMIVGTGCNVPAILATRVMESKRERLILATITILAVPCSAQTVVILGTIGKFGGIWYAALIYLILLAILLVLGRMLNHFMKFEPSGLMFEIPDLAMPHPRNVLFKTWPDELWRPRRAGGPAIAVHRRVPRAAGDHHRGAHLRRDEKGDVPAAAGHTLRHGKPGHGDDPGTAVRVRADHGHVRAVHVRDGRDDQGVRAEGFDEGDAGFSGDSVLAGRAGALSLHHDLNREPGSPWTMPGPYPRLGPSEIS